jgi:hypothetical protein
MKQYLIAAALLAGLSIPALATSQQQHYVVRDFTGYCAVLDSHPSPASHLKSSARVTIPAPQPNRPSRAKPTARRSPTSLTSDQDRPL